MRAVLFSRALLLALPHGRETDVELRSLNFVQLSKHGSGRVVAICSARASSGSTKFGCYWRGRVLGAALVGPSGQSMKFRTLAAVGKS